MTNHVRLQHHWELRLSNRPAGSIGHTRCDTRSLRDVQGNAAGVRVAGSDQGWARPATATEYEGPFATKGFALRNINLRTNNS